MGLLGGSFDPAHAGHVHITRHALARFALHRVWWLVSPANPLKREGPAAMERRIARARETVRDPRVSVTDIESRIGTRYTADTVAALGRHYPGVRFVWLMGGDNLAQIHLWSDWRTIFDGVPIGVLARPGTRMAARMAPAARAYAHARLRGAQSRALARTRPPAWAFVNIPLHFESSTALRRRGDWQRAE